MVAEVTPDQRETRGSLVFSENLFVAPVAIDYCHNAFI